MSYEQNKQPHKTDDFERAEKKRIPVFILIIVGIFLAALIFYMLADRNPKSGEVPADTTIPATQQNDTATATDSSVSNTTTAIAEDTQSATAKAE